MQVIINQFNRPEIKFTTECYREGSWGASSIGVKNCSMELFDYHNGSALIEFIVGEDTDYFEAPVEHIGIRYGADKKCLDYDGVCSIPDEAIELLKSQGFNTSEIEC